MAIQLDKNRKIISMKLVDIDTKVEMLLFERLGSRCHFYKEIQFEEYIINFRVDWGDIKNGHPVLDADIYKNKLAKRKKIKNGPWHHTERKFDKETDSVIYLFEFRNLQLRLMSQVSLAISVSMDAILEKIEE